MYIFSSCSTYFSLSYFSSFIFPPLSFAVSLFLIISSSLLFCHCSFLFSSFYFMSSCDFFFPLFLSISQFFNSLSLNLTLFLWFSSIPHNFFIMSPQLWNMLLCCCLVKAANKRGNQANLKNAKKSFYSQHSRGQCLLIDTEVITILSLYEVDGKQLCQSTRYLNGKVCC